MPNNLLALDTQFPNTEGKDTKESIHILTNYLFMLLENLKYTLNNLDKDNFNDEGLNEIAKIITKPIAIALKNANEEIAKVSVKAGAIETEVSNAKGDISRVSQKVDSLRLDVSNGEESSTISLEAGGAVISSQVIEFNGFVKFSDLSRSGSTYINGDNIRTGTINAIDINGSTINGGKIEGVSIEGSAFKLEGSGSGSISFYNNYQYAGGIFMRGSGYDGEVYVRATGGHALKLEGDGISLETSENIYMRAGTYLTLNADRIYLQSGNIFIGNEELDDYIRRIAK